MKLILASTSKYRAAQLTRLGLKFTPIAPKWNEELFKTSLSSAPQLAQTLATKKAKSLAQDFPDDILIGGDQVVTLGDHIFNKPQNLETALEHLKALSGQTHQLFTAITLIYQEQQWEHTDITHLSMRSLPEETLKSYLKWDQPFDCAGAYKIESGGYSLVKSIQTKDPSAIMGLPLIKLMDILIKLKYPIDFK